MINESPGRHAINQLADRLEAELRRLGAWSDTPLPPEKMQFSRAFGGDTMAFEQWIQFVLVARLREIAATGGPLPPSSQLRAYAVREFDGREDEMAALIDLLGAVDDLCPPPRHVPGRAPLSRPPLGTGLLFLLAAGVWAAVSLYAANSIAERIASFQPVRVLAYAHYVGRSSELWNALTVQIWGWETGESLRAYTANLALPARPRPGGFSPLASSIDVDFSTTPPRVTLEGGGNGPEFSPAGITRWTYGAAADSATATADPIPRALFELLDSLHKGTTADALETAMTKLGHLLGESTPHPEIKRYPASAGTGLFVGVFCAIFLPPMLIWMVWQYRRNLSRSRGDVA
ncbi:MAG: YqcC family protein [Phycisphaerales bacterium]|nr:YqcC family protein [Phycisphaerales bacterium]